MPEIPHNPLKQSIMDGITDWLRDEAPVGLKMMMTKTLALQLLDSICSKLEVVPAERETSRDGHNS
jgi:hypothetical protein